MIDFDNDDMCGNCKRCYGDHFGDTCPGNVGTTFVKQSQLTLMDCKVGDRVSFYEHTNSTNLIIGDLVLVGVANVLIAWKDGEKRPSHSWPKIAVSTATQQAMRNYHFGHWYIGITPLHRLLTADAPAVRVKSGMNCSARFCNTFCDYAEPNRADGKFVCYTCRQAGR